MLLKINGLLPALLATEEWEKSFLLLNVAPGIYEIMAGLWGQSKSSPSTDISLNISRACYEGISNSWDIIMQWFASK